MVRDIYYVLKVEPLGHSHTKIFEKSFFVSNRMGHTGATFLAIFLGISAQKATEHHGKVNKNMTDYGGSKKPEHTS